MATLGEWRPNRFDPRRARDAFQALERAAGSGAGKAGELAKSLLASIGSLLRLCPSETPVRTVLMQVLSRWPASPLQVPYLKKLLTDLESVRSPVLDHFNCGDLLSVIDLYLYRAEAPREMRPAGPFEAALGQLLSDHEARLYRLLSAKGAVSERQAIREVYGSRPGVPYPALQKRLENLQIRLNNRLRTLGLPTVRRLQNKFLSLPPTNNS
jgi:hypothetical protein